MNFASESGHWYTPQGEPAYETMGKNGKLRNTTLYDARRHGYFPSVSGIIKCAYAEALENWKQDRIIKVTYRTPPISGESEEDFIARIKAANREDAKKAPGIGSDIHTAIERCLAGKQYEYQTHVAGALDALRDWCGGPPYSSEKSFAHPLGFGGRVDVHKPGFVADFKSKEDFTPEKIPDAYSNHAMQLGAYRMGLNMPDARCAIIFISTSFPGLTHLVEVPNERLERGWRLFKHLLGYWKEDREYYPNDLVEA